MVREARESDKEPLLQFIRKIWDGHDYIPKVWDDWVADRSSVMLVVEAGGRPVGMNRMRYMPDGSAWLEGVRIHPAFRGKGLATMLGRASTERAEKRGVTTYRLTTHARNWRSQRQVAKMGMVEVSRLSVYEAMPGARFREQGGVQEVSAEGAEEAFRTVRATREYWLGGGLSWDTFAAVELTPEVFAAEVAAGRVFRKGTSVAVVKIGGEGETKWKQVCFVGGGVEDAVALVKHAFGRREQEKTGWRVVYLPQGSPIITALRGAGFKRAAPMVVYEGHLAKS